MNNINFAGKTLKEMALETGAEISNFISNLKIIKTAPASNMYFSGDVVLHITVKVDGCGLNNTGTWPFYLVDDYGIKKIIKA